MPGGFWEILRHFQPVLPEEIVYQIIRYFVKDKEKILGIEKIPLGTSNSNFIVRTDRQKLVLRIAPPRRTPSMFWEKDRMLLEHVVT